jgi:hypothetical protein
MLERSAMDQQKRREMQDRALQHLEAAAMGITDEIGDSETGYLIERALDSLRANTWPGGLDVPMPPRKSGG